MSFYMPQSLPYYRFFLFSARACSIACLIANRFAVFLECVRFFLPTPVRRFAIGDVV